MPIFGTSHAGNMILSFSCFVLLFRSVISGISYSCPPENILALVTANTNEIDMNAVPVTVCGQKRACVYTHGPPCAAKGQYASGVNEENGNVIHGCCQVTPPVQEHQGDDCHQVFIENADTPRLTSPPRPQPFTKNPSPAGGGGGKGPPPPPPKNEVVMEVKDLPPATPNQFVRSITRMNGNMQGYTVTVCTPQCRSSTTTTTTKRPTTQRPRSEEKQQQQQQQQQQQAPPPKPPRRGLLGGGGGGHHCFSSDMTVTTPTGIKRMDEIRAGDEVLVISPNSKPVFEPIEWLYHRDSEAEADFITVTTRTQLTLRLSANHLIPFMPCSNEELNSFGPDYLANSRSFFARRLKIGNCLGVLINNEIVADQVVAIKQERKRGIYSPITEQGTIIVNNVFVSCYSSVENHLAQRSVHSTLITLRHAVSGVWKTIFGTTLEREDTNVPLPLRVLLKVAQLVVPANVFSAY